MADEFGTDQGESGASDSLRRVADWFRDNQSSWLRGLLMLGFFLVFGVVRLIVGFVALFQFGFLLFTGEPSERLSRFGESVSLYTYDLVEYLTCAGDRLPFPFGPWPRPGSAE